MQHKAPLGLNPGLLQRLDGQLNEPTTRLELIHIKLYPVVEVHSQLHNAGVHIPAPPTPLLFQKAIKECSDR